MLPPRWRELQAQAATEHGWELENGGPGSRPGSGSEGGEDGGAAGEAAVGSTAAASEAASSEQQPEWADGVEADSQQQVAGEGAGGSEFGGPRMASLLFYGVRGQQQREGDAPSYFNALEVSAEGTK